jgi:hypothetical protein
MIHYDTTGGSLGNSKPKGRALRRVAYWMLGSQSEADDAFRSSGFGSPVRTRVRKTRFVSFLFSCL